MLERKMGMFN
jgi:hypothetical protein